MIIAGVGNALVDIVTEIPHDEVLVKLGLPKGSMTLIDEGTHNAILHAMNGLSQTIAAGGSAANTINGLAKLGTKTIFIGKIADDANGRLFIQDQQNSGIKPMLIHSKEEHTGKCVSLVSPCKERTMATFLGAASSLRADEIEIPRCSVLYVEGYLLYNHELIETVLRKAQEKGIKIALDLASYNVVADNLAFLKQLVEKYVDILFANHEEAHEFTGAGVEESLEIFAGLCEIAVVKIGAAGSWVARGKERHRVGVIEAEPKDKTGAGDLYASGFLYGLTKGYGMKRCGDIGAVLSSKVVEVMGPKMGDDRWAQIFDLVNKIENGEDVVNLFLEEKRCE